MPPSIVRGGTPDDNIDSRVGLALRHCPKAYPTLAASIVFRTPFSTQAAHSQTERDSRLYTRRYIASKALIAMSVSSRHQRRRARRTSREFPTCALAGLLQIRSCLARAIPWRFAREAEARIERCLPPRLIRLHRRLEQRTGAHLSLRQVPITIQRTINSPHQRADLCDLGDHQDGDVAPAFDRD